MPRRRLGTAVAQRTLVTHNINQHVGLIIGQTKKSLKDAETRQLAVKIVSDKTTLRNGTPMIKAWGQWFKADHLATCPPRVDLCEIESVWNFVVQNVRYVYDTTNVDVFVTAEETLDAGGGDCDDFTILFAALLMSIGFQVRARVISTPEAPNEWVHIYPLVGIPKDNPTDWMPLDATVTGSKPGWEYEDIAKTRDYNF
jgi:hypothetical protein